MEKRDLSSVQNNLETKVHAKYRIAQDNVLTFSGWQFQEKKIFVLFICKYFA